MAAVRRYEGFADLLHERTHAHSGDVAFVSEVEGELRSVTWGQLAASVERRSKELTASGASCEAIFCDGSLANVVEVFACALAGLQSVLISGDAPADEAERQVRAGDADAVWPAARRDALASALCPEPSARCGRGRVLFFTSGTTSSAKAVALTDASLMASAWNGASLLALGESDVVLNLLPISHVFGFVCGILWGLCCGATVALGRGRRHLFDDARLFKPTVMPLVPALLRALMARGRLNDELSMVLIGAASCPKELVEQARSRGIEVHCGYGLTETGSGVALSLGADTGALTICPADSVRISDAGEVLVFSELCMMEGYYDDAARTARVLRRGWLSTGDRGYLDRAGLLHVEGRLNDVVVLGNGTKVNLPSCEERVRSVLGEDDFAIVRRESSFLLVCGSGLSGFPGGEDELVDRANAALASESRDVHIAHALVLGHPLTRTESGSVRRTVIEREVEAWQANRK
jgi:long-subunit acyl-CoA synthetase (AMP-forming)